ncbi:hypothetical protein CB1_000683011 [Camelus ferus]|nr:hypothetical protein CB1_000683011 [Camelus ferus]
MGSGTAALCGGHVSKELLPLSESLGQRPRSGATVSDSSCDAKSSPHPQVHSPVTDLQGPAVGPSKVPGPAPCQQQRGLACDQV